MSVSSRAGSAALARSRLLGDRALAPVSENRARLAILGERLDRAGRAVLTEHLAGRVRKDRRFAPVLGTLMRMSLGGT